MTRQTLTPRQLELYNYLHCEINQYGRTTSLRRAGAALGISHTAVAQLLRALEKKGYVRRNGRYSRTIELLAAPPPGEHSVQGQQVPIIGEIAAGMPLYAQQQWDGGVFIDPFFFQGNNLFALRVRGDSMRNAGILHGDLAICEPREFAENGEIVVALIDLDEATVKRFYRQGAQIELRPENDDYQSMYYEAENVLIQGKVVGILRGSM